MSDSRLTLMEAISRRLTVEAQYNGTTIALAPHLMFQRHGDLFVAALNLGKVWRSDEEARLGQFKLAGISEARLLEAPFEPLPNFEAKVPRDSDTLILVI